MVTQPVTDATAIQAPPSAPTLRTRLEPYMGFLAPTAMIAAILLVMAVLEPARYFRLSNLEIILLESALYMPMAMAMTFVITQRGIDLSIGSVAALSTIIAGFLMKVYGFPAWAGVAVAISLGATMGLINGLIITKFKVPDLIGTLAMDLVYRGFALVLAKGLVLARYPDLITDIGRGQIAWFLPIPVLIGLATMIAGWILLTRTHFGRYTIAIGSDPQAAELTGVAIDRYKIYAYVLMGAMAGLAGVMLLGKLNAVQATSAPYFNLPVTAAVDVGGTSLFGGRASLLGSLAGVLLLALMINALVTLRIEFFWQSVGSGVVIVTSVALYTWLQKKDRDGARSLKAALALPETRRLLRIVGAILGTLLLVLLLGWAFAGEPNRSG
ncbi:MAG: ABC transporter permease [Pseudomonadota bacterium]